MNFAACQCSGSSFARLSPLSPARSELRSHSTDGEARPEGQWLARSTAAGKRPELAPNTEDPRPRLFEQATVPPTCQNISTVSCPFPKTRGVFNIDPAAGVEGRADPLHHVPTHWQPASETRPAPSQALLQFVNLKTGEDIPSSFFNGKFPLAL